MRYEAGADSEIYAMNADGSEDTKLASNTYYKASPRWSPDGAKIAYASPSSGPYYGPYGNNYEIYTMNADGTGQANITNNSSVDLSLDWGIVPAVS